MQPVSTSTFQPAAVAACQPGVWQASLSLWQREMVRFFRQRNRVVSALVTPFILWLMLGSGLDRMMHLPGVEESAGFKAFFFAGTLSMIVLFTAIFTTISVIEDRREGFLQAVLAAPLPRLAVVLGKVLGGASIAMIHTLVFLLLWPTVGPLPSVAAAIVVLLDLLLMSIALTALGLCIAWPMDSTAGFHAVMMIFLMPMWFLSGAIFPATVAPVWLKALMLVNPLFYGQSVLTGNLLGQGAPEPMLSLPLSLVGMVFFTAALFGLAVWLVNRPRKDGV